MSAGAAGTTDNTGGGISTGAGGTSTGTGSTGTGGTGSGTNSGTMNSGNRTGSGGSTYERANPGDTVNSRTNMGSSR